MQRSQFQPATVVPKKQSCAKLFLMCGAQVFSNPPGKSVFMRLPALVLAAVGNVMADEPTRGAAH